MDDQTSTSASSGTGAVGSPANARPRPRLKTRLPSEREMRGRRIRTRRDKVEQAVFKRYRRLGLLMLVSPALYFIDAISAYVLIVTGVVFLGIGGRGALTHGRRFQSGKLRDKWPSVEGVMVKSRLQEFPSSHPHSMDCLPDVEYSYSVRTKRYVGTNVRVGDSDDPLLEAQYGRWAPVVARYPKGALVRVFYNPENPRESCLEITESGAGLELTLHSVIAVQGFFGTLTGLVRLGS